MVRFRFGPLRFGRTYRYQLTLVEEIETTVKCVFLVVKAVDSLACKELVRSRSYLFLLSRFQADRRNIFLSKVMALTQADYLVTWNSFGSASTFHKTPQAIGIVLCALSVGVEAAVVGRKTLSFSP